MSENIALTNPEASSEEIVKLHDSRAHDFIMNLLVATAVLWGNEVRLSAEDNDNGLPLRTLLSNPKLLVMDEATSALDYETERKVCENLFGKLNDRTIFFILTVSRQSGKQI